MTRRPPVPLAAVAIAYLGYLIWQLATGAEAAVWVRFALALTLVFFLLRGNRIAGAIWLICNLLGAFVMAAATLGVARTNNQAAALFAAITAGVFAHCVYLFASPSVRRFQSTTEITSRPAHGE